MRINIKCIKIPKSGAYRIRIGDVVLFRNWELMSFLEFTASDRRKFTAQEEQETYYARAHQQDMAVASLY